MRNVFSARAGAMLLVSAGLLAATACGAWPTGGARASLSLAPCHIEGLAEEVQCGVLDVFEDREAARGRTIPIHVAVLPPLRRQAAPDPLFILAGGPGQGARSYAAALARSFRAVRRQRPIVLVDLRGTGASRPLTCLRGRDELEALAAGPFLYFGESRRCLAEIDADPRRYTHRDALADLDDVRRALGYERINLWGGSWGTRAAVIYALTYPDRVRRVVLDGAVGLQMAFPRGVAASAEASFNLLLDRCAHDAACAEAFPGAGVMVRGLVDSLAERPMRTRLMHPRTGQPVDVVLTRDSVAEIIRVALYTPVDSARIMAVVRRAAAGDFGPLAAQYVQSASVSTDDMAIGATMAVLCSEDLPAVAHTDFAAEARGSFAGSSYAEGWAARCRDWPAGPGIAVDRTGVSDAPALILSGALDPVTPPASGAAMARSFPAHTLVTVPGAAHNTSFTGCVPDLIARFLDGEAIDAGCVDEVPLPRIVTGPSGGRP